jgi:hypothetical protein
MRQPPPRHLPSWGQADPGRLLHARSCQPRPNSWLASVCITAACAPTGGLAASSPTAPGGQRSPGCASLHLWAGSPAASSLTGPKPNGPSRWPSSSAASTPPPPSWAPPGRRCAKPSPATASACLPATPRPSASGPSPPPASAPASRPPRAGPGVCALNPGALPARTRSEAELYQWIRREEQYAILGANVVVELYSESLARKPTTRA